MNEKLCFSIIQLINKMVEVSLSFPKCTFIFDHFQLYFEDDIVHLTNDYGNYSIRIPLVDIDNISSSSFDVYSSVFNISTSTYSIYLRCLESRPETPSCVKCGIIFSAMDKILYVSEASNNDKLNMYDLSELKLCGDCFDNFIDYVRLPLKVGGPDE